MMWGKKYFGLLNKRTGKVEWGWRIYSAANKKYYKSLAEFIDDYEDIPKKTRRNKK